MLIGDKIIEAQALDKKKHFQKSLKKYKFEEQELHSVPANLSIVYLSLWCQQLIYASVVKTV